MITFTGFSLRKSKLAAVLTGDLRHHTQRRNSPLIIHLSLFQYKYVVILFVNKKV